MSLLVPLLGCLLGSICLAQQAPTVDHDALRKALPVPGLEVTFGWTIGSNILTDINPAEVPQRIAALRQRLHGTPQDAGILVEIYDLQGKTDSADSSLLHRTVALAKARLSRAPRDAQAWLHLGMAHARLERYKEAENALRRATQLAPRHWKAWLELGKVLQWQALRSLAEASSVLPSQEEDAPSAEQLQQVSRRLQRMAVLMTKAEECMNRAVALAPQQPEVYHTRFTYRLLRNSFAAAFVAQRQQGEEVRIPELLTPDMSQDLAKLEALQPGNPAVQAVRVFISLFRYLFGAGKEGIGWEQMSPQARENYQQGIARLERLARSGERRQATWALRHLATARFFVKQFREQSLADLRRAIVLAPQERENYELLVTYLATIGREDEAIAECERWLRMKEDARAQVMLSKMLYDRGHAEKAKEHARKALRLAPRDIDANLLLAAYLLKEGQELAQAQLLLNTVATQMRESVPREKRAHYLMQRGVLLALQGNLDGARQAVARARELQPAAEEVDTLWGLLDGNAAPQTEPPQDVER
ncbi:MAG: tetratricopeptide repeat protein [Armatimonadetes bacterium]|nr:tetratricopeptide repeat protein [Armatimonadota bacterium]